MRSIYVPQLDRHVCRIGMGSVFFTSNRQDWVSTLLDAYSELGGNLIDTAKTYMNGEAHAAIAHWLEQRGNRADVIVMEKGCREEGSLTAEGLHKAVDDSLRGLRTDYIDLWVVHRDHPEMPVEPVVDALNDETTRRRIRAYGLSNWPVPRLAAAVEYAAEGGLRAPALSSPHLSLAVPMQPLWPGCLHATEEHISWHAGTGLPIFAWSALGHGFFAEDSGPENRSNEVVVNAFHCPDNFKRLARARQLATEKGATAAQVAIAYVLNLPVPTVALLGPQTVDEVRSCAAAGDITLTPAELKWLSLKSSSPRQ